MKFTDENEKRNTPTDWPQDSLGKFDFVTGCMWLVGIGAIGLVVMTIVMITRRFL
jgi:hypothetical protein